MNYFPNESAFDCFRSSLCNLLLEENEFKLAKQAYTQFQIHPLTTLKNPTEGIELGITLKLVRDLTQNKYLAKLQFLGTEYDLALNVFNTYSEKSGRKFSKVINQELSKDGICFVRKFKINTPNYIILDKVSTTQINHFIVQRDDGLTINDGFIEQTSKNINPMAILQIYKK
jgi:hypothetical protein